MMLTIVAGTMAMSRAVPAVGPSKLSTTPRDAKRLAGARWLLPGKAAAAPA